MCKYIFLILLLFLLSCTTAKSPSRPIASAVAVKSSEETFSLKYINTDWLNVRSSPSAENDRNKLFVLPYGTQISVSDSFRSSDWVKIRYNGVIGYVNSRYLSNNPPPVKPKPSPARIPQTKPNYFQNAMNFLNSGDYNRAVLKFKKALEDSPRNADIFYQLGNTYEKLGDVKNAILSYTDAIRYNNKLPRVYNNRGALYLKQNDYNKAIQDFSSAIELAPSDHEYYYNRGSTYYRMGSYDKAIIDLTNSIVIFSNDARVFVMRGNAYTRSNKRKEAISDYQKALSVNPNNKEAAENLRRLQN